MTDDLMPIKGDPPRRPRWTWGILARILAYGAVLFVIRTAATVTTHNYRLAVDLLHHGQTDTGEVVSRRTVDGRSTSYYLDVSYSAAGKSYDNDFEVDRDTYYLYPVNGPILVEYLPYDPSQVRIGAASQADIDDTLRGIFEWTIAAGVIGVMFLVALERRMWDEFYLLKVGQLASANIIGFTPYRTRYGSRYTWRYQFQVAGAKFIGTLDRASPPEISRINVLYEPVDPRHKMAVEDVHFARAD